MEFGLSEDQRLFDDALRAFLADHVTMDERRRIADARTGFDAALWQGAVDLGLAGLLVPEAQGGAGLGLFDAVVAAEAIGDAAAPLPFAGAMVMAPLALRLHASPAQQAEHLAKIATGAMRTGVGATFPVGQTGPSSLALDGDRLTGEVGGVIDAGGATHHLLLLDDGRAVLADATAAGVEATLKSSVDRSRPLADVRYDEVTVDVLAASNNAAAATRRVLDAGREILAADSLGACQEMIDQAVAYANQRTQFNRVIGSFQAVKHMCAEMATQLEPARSLVWYAGHAQDAAPDDAAEMAAHAKAHMGEIGREISKTATEVHGGMGFTDLMGLHFWFKRMLYNRQVLGSPEACRRDAARAQGLAS